MTSLLHSQYHNHRRRNAWYHSSSRQSLVIITTALFVIFTTLVIVPRIPSYFNVNNNNTDDVSQFQFTTDSIHSNPSTFNPISTDNDFITIARKKQKPVAEMEPWEYYSLLVGIFVLVLIGGLVAGLTIGLMSIDETNLMILKKSGNEKEKAYATKIEPIRKNGHLLLVTLLLTNTIVNETLPIIFHTLDLDGWQAVVLSTSLIVVFGEIIPQAICARHGLAVGAFFAYPVRFLIGVLFIIAYPVAKLLDWILGAQHGMIYRRAELKELLELHGQDQHRILTRDEVAIVRNVLEVKDKTAKHVMTDLSNVFMLSVDQKLDRETMLAIIEAGHSRIPIYHNSRENILGVTLVKQLILYDADDAVPVRDIKIRRLPVVRSSMPLFDLLHIFEQGGSHMAIVVQDSAEEGNNTNTNTNNNTNTTNTLVTNSLEDDLNTPGGMTRSTVLGIVTLEDVIENILGEAIIDETDLYVDMRTKVKVVRVVEKFSKRIGGGSVSGGGGGGGQQLQVGNGEVNGGELVKTTTTTWTTGLSRSTSFNVVNPSYQPTEAIQAGPNTVVFIEPNTQGELETDRLLSSRRNSENVGVNNNINTADASKSNSPMLTFFNRVHQHEISPSMSPKVLPFSSPDIPPDSNSSVTTPVSATAQQLLTHQQKLLNKKRKLFKEELSAHEIMTSQANLLSTPRMSSVGNSDAGLNGTGGFQLDGGGAILDGKDEEFGDPLNGGSLKEVADASRKGISDIFKAVNGNGNDDDKFNAL